jgi:peptidyl-prolyl cis-trans isomerase B (cyclophilin B)
VTFVRRRLVPLFAVLLAAGSLAACGGGTTTHRAVKTECSYPQDPAGAAKKASLPPGNPPKDLPDDVTIATNRGDIRVSLAKDQAPCTVNSFVALAEQGYFDDTHCHRLTTAGIFVLQCGDPTGTGTGGPGYSYGPVENAPKDNVYQAGTVAMARQGDKGDSMGSQFFLVYKDSTIPADSAGGYTVLGDVTKGEDVVDKVAAEGAAAADAGGNTAPNRPVSIVTTSVSAG